MQGRWSHEFKACDLTSVCNLPVESGGWGGVWGGFALSHPCSWRKHWRGLQPQEGEGQSPRFLHKADGTGTEADSIREGCLEEAAHAPFSCLLPLPSGLSALPSSTSLCSVPVRRCSSSWMVACGGQGPRGWDLSGADAGPGVPLGRGPEPGHLLQGQGPCQAQGQFQNSMSLSPDRSVPPPHSDRGSHSHPLGSGQGAGDWEGRSGPAQSACSHRERTRWRSRPRVNLCGACPVYKTLCLSLCKYTECPKHVHAF